MREQLQDMMGCYQKICELSHNKCFVLVAVVIEKWNDELTPWEFRNEKMSFGWLVKEYYDHVE